VRKLFNKLYLIFKKIKSYFLKYYYIIDLYIKKLFFKLFIENQKVYDYKCYRDNHTKFKMKIFCLFLLVFFILCFLFFTCALDYSLYFLDNAYELYGKIDWGSKGEADHHVLSE
jgi:hypothetical protein